MNEYHHSDYADEFRSRSGAYWTTAVAYARGSGPPPCRPYQVEVHPVLVGSPICLQRCVDCHGQFHRERGVLTQSHYDELIDDLITMRVPSVVLSGVYSDPSCNESLLMSFLHRGGPHWGVKLHTYGLGLTPMVRDAIVQAALDDPYDQSYVTLSKSTTDSAVFNGMCRPIASAPNLRAEEANLRDLFNLVEKHGAHVEVRLNCRVTRMNGRPHQIANMLRWLADTPQFVKIRFTTDYVPSGASPEYLDWFTRSMYVPPDVAQQSISKAIVDAKFREVDLVSFRDPEASSYSDKTCYNGLLFSTVAANGRLYPCQGVAVSVYDRLSYGDLTQRRFPECWNEYVQSWEDSNPIKDGCPKCAAACERMINDALSKEVNRGIL